jgi:hypothetical protein
MHACVACTQRWTCWAVPCACKKQKDARGLAFAAVVGVQHEADVFEDHNDGERPEDERHGAQHLLWAGLRAENIGEDVQRGGACMPGTPVSGYTSLFLEGGSDAKSLAVSAPSPP